MSRYTLSDEQHPDDTDLFRVLDNGVKTEAFASSGATFSDKCYVRRGRFYGGTFHDGTFYDGTFNGGRFYDGTFYDGTFNGGWFCGGEYYSGVFNGGWFLCGEYYHGWLPLQIQGSKHFVHIPDGKTIKIGCHRMTPEEWLQDYKAIGEQEGYTPEQIREYKRYIDLAAEMIEENSK